MMRTAERRLGAVFQRALLVALAGTGCSTKGADVEAAPEEAGVDASIAETGTDSGNVKEAGPFDPCESTPFTPVIPDTCGDLYRYPCGLPPDLTIRGDCIFAINDCAALCPDIHYNCRAADGYCTDAGGGDSGDEPGAVIPDEAGAVVIDCVTCPGSAGRVPAGLEAGQVRARSALGAYFACAARLEAASVTAFRRLHDELALHGAPAELIEGARAAEHDEVRHTRAMARLARRHGGRYERPRVAPVALRSLEAVAYENAIEGCARETFGALLATWQAANVADPELARTLGAIAEDETRHAALSWAIASWSLAKLDREAVERMQSAWSSALADIGRADGEAVAAIALPSREQREQLATELRGLWSELAA